MDISLISLAGFAYGGALGACFASFLCVVAERVPDGVPIGGRSHCACGRQLRAFENVPVLGWLRVAGRARCCGATLPVRYVLTELVSALVVGALTGTAFYEWFNGVAPVGTPMLAASTAAAVAVYLFLLVLVLSWLPPVAATEDPTEDPTEEPTEDPTEEPTGKPTEEPTGDAREHRGTDPVEAPVDGARDAGKAQGPVAGASARE